MDDINNPEYLKSNKNFANELRRCRLILDICFTDNIENKVLVDKKEIELRNKNTESNDSQKDIVHNRDNFNNQ